MDIQEPVVPIVSSYCKCLRYTNKALNREDVKQQTQQINSACEFLLQHNLFLNLTVNGQVLLLRNLFWNVKTPKKKASALVKRKNRDQKRIKEAANEPYYSKKARHLERCKGPPQISIVPTFEGPSLRLG